FNVAVMSAGDVQRAGDAFTVTGDWSLIQLPFRGFGANFGLRVSVALATGVEIFDMTGLMLTRNPTQTISLLQHAGYVEDDDGGDGAATVVAEASPYDTHVIRTTATNSGGGINTFFGYDGAGGPRSITVEPNTDYTLTIYAKGNSGYSGHQLSLVVLNQDDEDLGGDATVLTGDWQALVAAFTTGANDTSIVILSRIESHDAGLSYDIAGFTLVDSHTTPATFNAGDSTNFLDEITPYVISVNYHYGFAEQLDLNVGALFEGMAEPAECTIELDNSTWDFLPEDSGATFYELFGPGMLVKVQAEVDNTTYPMFIGRL